MEFYNHFTNETLDVRFSDIPDIYYKCVITIYNMNYSDIGDLVNANMFINMDELIGYNMDRSLKFMQALIKNGFTIYVRV